MVALADRRFPAIGDDHFRQVDPALRMNVIDPGIRTYPGSEVIVARFGVKCILLVGGRVVLVGGRVVAPGRIAVTQRAKSMSCRRT